MSLNSTNFSSLFSCVTAVVVVVVAIDAAEAVAAATAISFVCSIFFLLRFSFWAFLLLSPLSLLCHNISDGPIVCHATPLPTRNVYFCVCCFCFCFSVGLWVFVRLLLRLLLLFHGISKLVILMMSMVYITRPGPSYKSDNIHNTFGATT